MVVFAQTLLHLQNKSNKKGGVLKTPPIHIVKRKSSLMNENIFEKKSIQISPRKLVQIEFEKQDISIYPYISLGNETKIISDYCGSLFKEGGFLGNYIEAEYSLYLSVLDLCTDIKLADENNVMIDLDDIVSSGLWKIVVENISNYLDVRDHLDEVVVNIISENDLKKSIGGIIDKLSVKVFELLDKVSNIDFSENGIKELVSQLKEQTTAFTEKFGDISKTGGE
jgi:hypothetical protein